MRQAGRIEHNKKLKPSNDTASRGKPPKSPPGADAPFDDGSSNPTAWLDAPYSMRTPRFPPAIIRRCVYHQTGVGAGRPRRKEVSPASKKVTSIVRHAASPMSGWAPPTTIQLGNDLVGNAPYSNCVKMRIASQIAFAFVDDDPAVRQAVSIAGKSLGFQILAFERAEDFLLGYDRSTPNCLVLDVRMPGTTGLELQRTLREADVWIPISMMSGHANVRMAVDAMALGAMTFLEKPFRMNELSAAIETAIQQSRKHIGESRRESELRQKLESLTTKEREVLDLLLVGRTNKEIASELHLSVRAIEDWRSRVMKRMGGSSLVELVAYVRALHWEWLSDIAFSWRKSLLTRGMAAAESRRALSTARVERSRCARLMDNIGGCDLSDGEPESAFRSPRTPARQCSLEHSGNAPRHRWCTRPTLAGLRLGR